MTDLFNFETRPQPVQSIAPYPDGPGAHHSDTSREGAAFIAPHAGTLQERALSAIRAAGDHGATTNELCALLQVGKDSLQPRTSELRKNELIFDSGIRRKNSSGVSAIVWTANRSDAISNAPKTREQVLRENAGAPKQRRTLASREIDGKAI